MNRLLIGAAAAALVTGTGIAVAQTAPQTAAPAAQPPGTPQVRVKTMGDRVTTREETVEHVRKLFTRLDTNRDGYITREESDSAHQRMMAMHHRSAAGDMPMPDRAAVFTRLDTNHDGAISRDEFMAGQPEVRRERIVMKGGPEGGMGKRIHGGRFGMDGHMFEMADANRDGRVTLAEATDAAARHFDQADLNHDGKLTPDERRQAHRAMRSQAG